MARFGINVKRRTKRTATFHVDNITSRDKLKANRTMSNTRLVGTAISLTLGGLMCFSAMHYAPAYMGSNEVLSLSNLDSAAARMIPGKNNRNMLTPYMDLFEIKRTYLRPGQRIQAKYNLSQGTVVELRIRRCQQQFILEVFDCNVIGEKKMTVENKTSGSHEFMFEEAGFYLFDERVVKKSESSKKSYITWRRS